MIRREVLAGFAGLAALRSTRAAAADAAVRGVRLGLTSNSLDPLPLVPGRDAADLVIEQCRKMGAGDVELSARFFGPPLPRGRAPEVPTPAYLEIREVVRRWRLSPASLADFTAVRAKFERSGINLLSISNTFHDDCTDAEIDAMFRQMRTLGIRIFQTSQTRVSMAARLKGPAERYGISPAWHPHSRIEHPDDVATPESLARVLAVSPTFRVCLDIGHFVAGNNDPVAYIREHHARITHLHVKDRRRDDGPHVVWGKGDTPIRECLHLIRDNRWPIVAMVERENQDGTGTPYEQTKADVDAMRAMLNA